MNCLIMTKVLKINEKSFHICFFLLLNCLFEIVINKIHMKMTLKSNITSYIFVI